MQVSRGLKTSLILPSLAVIFFVVIYPTAYLIYYSFTDFSLEKTTYHFVGLYNFIQMLRDPFFLNSLVVTAKFVLLTVPAECVLGLLVAICLVNIKSQRLSSILHPLSISPVVLTPVVVGMIWLIIVNPDYGLINTFLKFLRIPPIPFVSNEFWAPIIVALVDIWQWTPFFILLSVAGIYSIRREILEAAQIDGATGWTMFRNIIFPLISPLILFGLLIRLIDAFKIYDIIYIMTYGGPGITTEVLSFRIWKIAFLERNIGYASAWGILSLIHISEPTRPY